MHTIHLIILIILTNSLETTSTPYCLDRFTSQQYHKEIQLNKQISKQLDSIFEPEPYFLSKIFKYLKNQTQNLNHLILKAIQKIKNIHLSLVTFIIFLIIVISTYLVIKMYYKQHKIYHLIKNIQQNNKFIRIQTIFIIIVSISAIIIAFQGITQSNKFKKSLIHILCSAYQQPTNLLKYQNGTVSYHQFLNKIQQAEKQMVDNLATLRPALKTLSKLDYSIELGKLIQNSIEQSQQSKEYLNKLNQSLSVLSEGYESSRKQIIIWQLFRIYEGLTYSISIVRVQQIIVNAIKNYGYRSLNFQLIFKIIQILYKSIFLIVIIVSLMMIYLIINQFRKKPQIHNRYLILLQYIIIILIIIFILLIIINSILLPILYWLSNGIHHTFLNQSYFMCNQLNNIEQFDRLNKDNPQIAQVTSMLFPLNKNITSLYKGICLQRISNLNHKIKPYINKQILYFYHLFQSAIPYINNQTIKSEIQIKINQNQIQYPIISYLHNASQALQQIITSFQPHNNLDTLNIPSFGLYINNIIQPIFTCMINRSFTSVSISKILITLLSLMMMILILNKKRNKLQYLTKINQQQTIQL